MEVLTYPADAHILMACPYHCTRLVRCVQDGAYEQGGVARDIYVCPFCVQDRIEDESDETDAN